MLPAETKENNGDGKRAFFVEAEPPFLNELLNEEVKDVEDEEKNEPQAEAQEPERFKTSGIQYPPDVVHRKFGKLRALQLKLLDIERKKVETTLAHTVCR